MPPRCNDAERLRPATRARVEQFTDDLRGDPVASGVVAVVVCGSAARGEDAPDETSDIDVMVVTHSASPLVGRRVTRVLERHAELGIEGGQVPLRTLSRHRSLVNYEARFRGAVVHGDATVLDAVPMDGPADIPGWEAVRLLANRVMEHVKHRAGELGDAAVIAKSYEAMGEAQLVLEGRYRPSFEERWAEVKERPLEPRLQSAYLGVSRRRRGQRIDLPGDVAAARADLLRALEAALAADTGCSGPVPAQFDCVARRERHLSHRLYWLVAGDARPRVSTLRTDPCLVLWSRAARLVARPEGPPAEARRLADAWRRCPQIYATPAS